MIGNNPLPIAMGCDTLQAPSLCIIRTQASNTAAGPIAYNSMYVTSSCTACDEVSNTTRIWKKQRRPVSGEGELHARNEGDQ